MLYRTLLSRLIYSYTLLPHALYSLIHFCRLYILLYSLSYIYSYILHSLIYCPAYFTPLLYTSLYTLYSLIYSPLYHLLYTLLYTLMALLILPRRFIPILSYILFSYILAPLIFIFLYSHTLYSNIVIPTLLYRKGYNYAAADFYTLYIAILILTAALISQLFYTSLLKSGKGGGRNCRTPLKYRTIYIIIGPL